MKTSTDPLLIREPPAGLTMRDIKRLCWLAYCQAMPPPNVGLPLSWRRDAFNDWWKRNAEFLLTVLPVEASPDYQDPADIKQ